LRSLRQSPDPDELAQPTSSIHHPCGGGNTKKKTKKFVPVPREPFFCRLKRYSRYFSTTINGVRYVDQTTIYGELRSTCYGYPLGEGAQAYLFS
jgi:hypothetical protein